MKILFLANSGAGLMHFRSELVRKLKETNEVTVSFPADAFREDFEKMGCKFENIAISRRGTNPVSDLKLLLDYVKMLRRLKPDVVLTYTIKPNIYGGMATAITKTPCIANVTGLGTSIENSGLLGKLAMTLYRIGLKKAKCVFFQNEANLKLFTEAGIVTSSARLIPGSGVNVSAHPFTAYPEKDGTDFLFIGRIMRDKGMNELLEAIHAVHEKHPDVRLEILGKSDEADYSARLEEEEKTGYIHYSGTTKDVNPFIAHSHCVVLPSYHEGMANVMLEAASSGRPVISTRVPGCAETYEEGVTGLGCEAKNAASLIEAMERFIAMPKNERAEMGRRGREFVEKKFDRNIVIRAYTEEIAKACKK